MINLGSNVMGIGLSVFLRNQFSAPAATINSSMTAMQVKAVALQSSFNGLRIAGAGMAIGGLLIANSYRKAVVVSSEFNYLMKAVQAVTQATNEELRVMGLNAIRISKSTVYTAREVASAMKYLGTAGFTSAQINQSIDAVVALGAATGESIEGKGGVGDMMTNMMTSFGMSAKQSMRMADILAMATSRANTDMRDLEQTMKYLGNAARELNQPFEDAAAMAGTLANAGIKSGMAGRGLANVLIYLAKVSGKFRTPKQAAVLASIGLDPKELRQANGELKPMAELIDLFREKMHKIPGPDRLSVLTGIMNIRGARAFSPLFADANIGLSFVDLMKKLRDGSEGAAKRMAEMRLDNLAGDTIILKSAWEAFKIAQGNAIEPLLRIVVKGLTKVVNVMTAIAEHPAGKVLLGLGGVFAVAAIALGGFLVLFSTFAIMITTSSGGIKAMGASLVWAWRSAKMELASYMAMQQGMTITSGGAFVQTGKKGFQKPGTLSKAARGAAQVAAGGAGGAAGAKAAQMAAQRGLGQRIMISFFRTIQELGGFFKVLGKILRVFTSAAASFVGIVTVIIGLKNTINLVIRGFGTFLHALLFIYDYAKGLFSGDVLGKEARKNFNTRQRKINKAVGGIDQTDFIDGGMPSNSKSENKRLREQAQAMFGDKNVNINVKTDINMDGKKVGEAISKSEQQSLADLLNMNSQ